MNCRDARGYLEESFDDEESLEHVPGLEEHLDTCGACRDWYALEQRVVDALEQLETFPTPSDFTARVLSQLPDTIPEPRSSPATQVEGILHRAQEAWDSLVAGLSRPASRRRMMPALVAAASLLLVLGLLYVFQGNEISATPGAATGNWPWAIGGVVLAAALIAVALILLRRRK